MKIAIMQPAYLPWLGYFDLMDSVDCFVLLDNVPFSKQGRQQRNQIKTHQGILMLTVPVVHQFGQLICDVHIDNRILWTTKHWRSIQYAYQKAPFWNEFSPALSMIYEQSWSKLSELNVTLISCFKKTLNISTPLILASEMGIVEENKSERLIKICKKLKGTLYYSPIGAKDYLLPDLDLFAANALKVEFCEFQHPIYTQLHGDFVAQMSIVDLILNAGNQSLEIIRKGRRLVENVN